MNVQLNVEVRTPEEIFEKCKSNEPQKNCPQCGQGMIPFRYGRCFVCKKQISYIQYITQTDEWVSSNHDDAKIGITSLPRTIDKMEMPD